MDGGAWWAAVHGVAKSQTWLSDFTFTFHFHALQKEMATHSSVLAWRIPGTGELGGLPSMGSHRVGHDWSNLAAVQKQPHAYQLVKVSAKYDGYIHKMERLLFAKKKKKRNEALITCKSMDELWKHSKRKKPITKAHSNIWYRIYEVTRISKPIETE